MKRLSNSLLLVMIFVLTGCTDGEITGKPNNTPDTITPETSESTLSVNGKINLGTVSSELNNSIPHLIAEFADKKNGCFKKWGVSVGCKWWGEVTKRGAASLSGSGDRLSFSIPIHSWVTVKSRGDIKVEEKAKTDLTVFVDARPTLSPEWDLDLNMNTNFRWDKKPTLYLLDFIKITVGDLAEPEIRKQLGAVTAEANKIIEEAKIKESMSTAWTEMHKPIKISESPDVWLRINPTSVAFTGISTSNNILNAAVEVTAKPETLVGKEPEPLPTAPLPVDRHAKMTHLEG